MFSYEVITYITASVFYKNLTFFPLVAIVTRAALKGMADSVGVFIPILKTAADQIRNLPNGKKMLTRSNNSNLTDSSQQLHGGMNSVVEEDEGDAEVDAEVESVHFADLDDVIETDQVSSPPSNITPAASHIHKVENNINHPLNPEPSAPVNVAPVDTQKRPKQQKRSISTTASAVKGKKISVVDFVSSNLMSIATVILFIFTVYMMMAWYKSASRLMQESNIQLQHNTTNNDNIKYVLTTRSSHKSRSVYIRDLDEGFLKNSILPPYAKSER